jgi:cellulose synthase/poly-beta-1,6-N-acetylglucosamine synthase-like glycosyltransferase
MAQGDGAASSPRADLRPAGPVPLRRTPPPLRPVRGRLAECPELDCLRHRLPPAILAAAELRAAEIGTGAQDVLIADGHVGEDAYVAAFARSLGLVFDRLEGLDRIDCPWTDEQLVAAPVAGRLPLLADGRLGYAMVADGYSARRIVAAIAATPQLRQRLCLTTRASLARFAGRHAEREIAYRSAFALKERVPVLSAGARWMRGRLACAAAMLGVGAGLVLAPDETLFGLHVLLALIFFEWMALRIGAALQSVPMSAAPVRIRDRDLPVYTVIVALYREASALPGLIDALRALDYPREKLDIKIAVEPDDDETQAALRRLDPGAPFEIVVAPAAGPRTKPKALNAALLLARGSLTAVYDAEDRPDADQLRRAAEMFASSDGALACVQARLTIDNSADSWLTRLYTAEYAGLFDAFLPGIARWRLPLPLGGSSNHFRTHVLRRAGAWDPFNVTEDADLGVRLARLGYRTAMLDSSTYEEAPARFGPWLRQRTRWFKGWLRTWLVHVRQPLHLLRELGALNFIVFQLLVGGSVLAALVHPLFVIAFAVNLATDPADSDARSLIERLMPWLYGGTFLAGYATSAFVGLAGLAHRGLLGLAWWLVLMPLYWWCLSIAAWRALAQAAFDPYRWEKTDHGVARTSRRAAATGRKIPPAGSITAR